MSNVSITNVEQVTPEDELEQLESDLVEALEANIGDLAEDQDFALYQIQPPTSIVRAAAVAAAQVLMAFEPGYRMDTAPEELSLPAPKTEHLGFWVETPSGQRMHIHGDPEMSHEVLESLINAANLAAGKLP